MKARLRAVRRRGERYTAFRVLASALDAARRDRVPHEAAALTYYGIFSLFPLILLLMALGGVALQSNEVAREQVMSLVVGVMPRDQGQLQQVFDGVVDAKGTAAGLGLLMLLWGVLGWFEVIDVNINHIRGADRPRSFLKGKLFALAMATAFGGVALTSFAATATVALLASFSSLVPGSVDLWRAVVALLSVLTIATGFFVLYRYTPRQRVESADVWPAAVTAALVWEATRHILAFSLERNIAISGYGPIGAAMALLFWIYVTSNIILVGAELAHAIARERRHVAPERRPRVVAKSGPTDVGPELTLADDEMLMTSSRAGAMLTIGGGKACKPPNSGPVAPRSVRSGGVP